MKFTCECCGKEQESWPAIGYKSPSYYHSLSEEEKAKNVTIDSDTCVVKEGTEIYRFIRGVLVQKVNDTCQDLEYGVWVSLGEKSFTDYVENSEKEAHEKVYFGWLDSLLPDYEYEEQVSIKTNVLTQGEGLRPIIEIQINEGRDSNLVKDYHEGISEEEAILRIERVLKNR